MKFQVPQFIETEDKIIGPLTLKQFLWLAGGVLLIFILFKSLSSFYFILAVIPIIAISLAFAFYKIDNMPLFSYILNAIRYSVNPKRYYYKSESQNPKNLS